jgi:hypothetical protein
LRAIPAKESEKMKHILDNFCAPRLDFCLSRDPTALGCDGREQERARMAGTTWAMSLKEANRYARGHAASPREASTLPADSHNNLASPP